MSKKFDIVALGEVLIDFTVADVSESGMRLFEQNPGGAPANMLTAALQAGLDTAFIGKVGTDMHGKFLRETLDKIGIDTSGLVSDEEVFTTLAFVSLNAGGEREFSFARKPGADTMLKSSELNEEILKNTKVLHVGSLSLTHEPSRTTTFDAVKIAKKAGAIISYDPNYREKLWENVDEAKKWMSKMLEYADIMKISDEETKLLTPFEKPEEAAKYLIDKGVKIVCITLGANGVYIANKDTAFNVAGFKANVVDTTGAGDSFWGGLVSRILTKEVDINNMTESELYDIARYGNAVASLCIEKRGGITGIPNFEEIEERLKRG